jgi:DNA-binding transcriptional ArsR family regulator
LRHGGRDQRRALGGLPGWGADCPPQHAWVGPIWGNCYIGPAPERKPWASLAWSGSVMLKGSPMLGGPGPMANLRRVLWHLLGGTRGGPLRIRILLLLRDRPYNTNQVASLLAIDYKTAQHHLRVLTENRLVSPTGDGYGAVYLFTKDMEDSLGEFDRIVAKVAPLPAAQQPPQEVRSHE